MAARATSSPSCPTITVRRRSAPTTGSSSFASASDLLVAGDSNGRQDVFVRDRQTGTTTIVSRASDGSPANDDSGMPVISANGRYVAFASLAGNLVGNDTNGTIDVFVRDLQTGALVLASVSPSGAPANFGADEPTISADGRHVAYSPGASGGVRVRDRQDGPTVVVTAPGGAPPDGLSDSVSISEDGRLVYFDSQAANLVPGDTNGLVDGFLFVAAPTADLSLTMSASTLQPGPGSDVTFSIGVGNGGPSHAVGVAVRALLPAGLNVVSDTSGGSYNPRPACGRSERWLPDRPRTCRSSRTSRRQPP